MKTLLVTAALVFTVLFVGAPSAEAGHGRVSWSVTIGHGGYYHRPYCPPPPPRYCPPPRYYHPPAYYRPPYRSHYGGHYRGGYYRRGCR